MSNERDHDMTLDTKNPKRMRYFIEPTDQTDYEALGLVEVTATVFHDAAYSALSVGGWVVDYSSYDVDGTQRYTDASGTRLHGYVVTENPMLVLRRNPANMG